MSARVKAKLDENLPAELLDDLRAAGHEADTVDDEALPGRGPEPRGRAGLASGPAAER